MLAALLVGRPGQDRLERPASTRGATPPRTWHVELAANGDGSRDRPFGTIADALAAAQAGDTVLVSPGAYPETIRTVRGGRAGAPITIVAADPTRRPVVATSGRVLAVNHPHIVVDGFVLDGDFGPDDAVRVGSEAHHLVLRHVDVRRAGRDCIDMASPADVLVEHALIHHCLDATDGRRDAHGLVAGAVERLTVRDTEIHTFSGDAIQIDPSRTAPGWTDVRLERLRLWLAPLTSATNGFAAGTVPGENAVDTKTPKDGRRARLTIRDVEAFGFRGGLIANMAAFNLKERVDATVERVLVHHSEVGFRVRGPGDQGAALTVRGAVLHHVATGFRYEDDLATLIVDGVTFGREVDQPFRNVHAAATRPDVRGVVLLGSRLPAEARGRGRAVGTDAFVNAAADDYRPAIARVRP